MIRCKAKYCLPLCPVEGMEGMRIHRHMGAFFFFCLQATSTTHTSCTTQSPLFTMRGREGRSGKRWRRIKSGMQSQLDSVWSTRPLRPEGDRVGTRCTPSKHKTLNKCVTQYVCPPRLDFIKAESHWAEKKTWSWEHKLKPTWHLVK